MTNFEDAKIVEFFVNHLRINGHPNLKVDRIPDKEKIKGDKKKDIDAIAGHFAIEHTSLDTVKNQSRDSARFLKVVGDLEAEISPQLNYRLGIILQYEGIKRGQKWSSVRESLKAWIINLSPKLPDGRHIIDNVPGIPFQFHVNKASDRRPGLIFGRFAPEHDDFSNRLRGHLNRKATKLIPYKEQGFKTVLLIESDDIALMDEDIMLDGIREAFSRKVPDGVDQI